MIKWFMRRKARRAELLAKEAYERRQRVRDYIAENKVRIPVKDDGLDGDYRLFRVKDEFGRTSYVRAREEPTELGVPYDEPSDAQIKVVATSVVR